MTKLFAFLDLETTGLYPGLDCTLEAAWVLTDGGFRPVSKPKTFLVDLGGPGETGALRRIEQDEYVLGMHTDSGLLHAMGNEPLTPMSQIADAFVSDVLDQGNYESLHLAGYSVGFDRSFLQAEKAWAPLFKRNAHQVYIHHRLLDLSANMMMWEAAGVRVPSTVNLNPHRALSDVLDTLDFAQQMQGELALSMG